MTVEDLAAKLDISPKALEARRRKFRMEHGEEAEAKLLRALEREWDESRDKVQVLGKNGQVITLPFDDRRVPYRGQLLGEDPTEPELMPLSEESIRARQEAFDVLKGEEKARREARSRAERIRQAELDLREKGRPHEHHVQAIEERLAAMRRDAA